MTSDESISLEEILADPWGIAKEHAGKISCSICKTEYNSPFDTLFILAYGRCTMCRLAQEYGKTLSDQVRTIINAMYESEGNPYERRT